MQDPSLGLVEDANSIALMLGLLLGILFLVLPRRYALLPIVLAACFLPVSGKFGVAGLHFSMLRVVVTFGWARMVFRGEIGQLKWARIDSIIVAWSIVRVLAFILLWQTSDAVVNALGYAYDAVGLYFLLRVLIRDIEDLKKLLAMFAVALFPVALLMCAEKISGRNWFHIFGGVPEFATIRNAVVRGQGPFGHPILAGTFGAVWLALFVGLWLQGKGNRAAAVLGIVASTLITWASGSSGPIGSYMAGIVGLSMWSMRNHMRAIRWGIAGCVVALHMVMKDPVWFIFARVDVISGSTGWHRANLIDRAIANFSDWCLVGGKDVAKWGVWAGDTTNQFIVEGIRGGAVTLILFVWIIVSAFSCLGVAMRRIRQSSRSEHLLLWSLGVAIFAHVISFFGVSYFDQNVVNWYLVLAMVAVATSQRPGAQPNMAGTKSQAWFIRAEDSLPEYEAGVRQSSAIGDRDFVTT